MRASSIATTSRKACGSDLTSRRFRGKEGKEKGEDGQVSDGWALTIIKNNLPAWMSRVSDLANYTSTKQAKLSEVAKSGRYRQ
jgi:hypothetical protein